MYQIIYTDNPYEYPKRNEGKKFGLGSQQYRNMTDEEMMMLYPFVDHLLDTNGIVLSWASGALDYRNNKVMESWGLYKVTELFTWIKIDKKGHERVLPGNYTGSNTEDLWLYRKLNSRKSLSRQQVMISQIIKEPLREHSRKPDIIRKLITDIFGDLPRLEMFARKYKDSQYMEGWNLIGGDITGNEIEDDLRLLMMNDKNMLL